MKGYLLLISLFLVQERFSEKLRDLKIHQKFHVLKAVYFY
jgi:hypothetical protein